MNDHWNNVYRNKQPTEVSWFSPHLEQSLRFIDACNLPLETPIVDIGAGASTLVDDLLERGFRHITLLDLSEAAFEHTKARLGVRANGLTFIVGDASEAHFADDAIGFWHDRAVFHFLTDPVKRDAYLAQVRRCVRPHGYALIATFALDGPEKCSGLPVQRYSPEHIAALMGDKFELVANAREVHDTPWGSQQPFSYALLQRNA